MLQGENCCITIVKDKKSEKLTEFHVFDPYADEIQDSKNDKNLSAGCWMTFSNIEAILEYAALKLQKISNKRDDEILPYRLYHITICEKKTIKSQRTGYFLFNSSMDENLKSCKLN